MLSFLIRRVFYALIMLVVVSFVSFIIISLPPGDYMTQRIRELESMGDKSAETRLEQYRIRYGLEKPFLTQYWLWISNFVQGDFGLSFEYEQPVATLLKQRLPLSVTLAVTTTVFTWAMAIPIGVFSAVKQYSLGDQIFTTLSFIGVGIPSFLMALVVLYIAIVKLDQDVIGLFSRNFQDAPWSLAKVWDLLKHMWVPALIGAITGTSGTIRIMRGNLLDTLGQPFIEAARARGLKNRTVIWRHAVRMAINPLIVILGTETFPAILAGNILVEVVLSLPTMGPLYIRALLTQDMFTAGTVLVLITLMVMIGALVADLALAWVDPRIRLD
ncbi:MAG: ABC transporter permease [Anaerolineales bacterium]|nr:ABC transporter permease [Chloroflexota bacterium]MBL7164344.1 ABC transporter permease [Anaerolineales bacterium]